MRNIKFKSIAFILLFLNACLSYGQTNGNCATAFNLAYNDTLVYSFDNMNSSSDLGCTRIPNNKHWFNLTGNGNAIKLEYSLTGDPNSDFPPQEFLFILSGECDSLACIKGGIFKGLFYFLTEEDINYHFVIAGNKVYSNPNEEPGGNLFLKSTEFDPNCSDSLIVVESISPDTIIAAESIEFHTNIEVINSNTFECIIFNCESQN